MSDDVKTYPEFTRRQLDAWEHHAKSCVGVEDFKTVGDDYQMREPVLVSEMLGLIGLARAGLEERERLDWMLEKGLQVRGNDGSNVYWELKNRGAIDAAREAVWTRSRRGKAQKASEK